MVLARVGYARVSTIDQDTALQVAALTAAGCGVVREEKASATTIDGRTELATVLAFLQKGDVLVVTRIDRLAQSIGDLQTIVKTELSEHAQHVEERFAGGSACIH
jgi:DNA invertase Pin-like site-specific DNA recombinase